MDTLSVEKEDATAVEIYVWVDNLRLRSEPNTKSQVVATLKEGEALRFLDERSDFSEKITLRGTQFDEPWLKVATKSNQEGWVYGGGIKFYKIGIDTAPTPFDDCFKLQKDRKFTQARKCLKRSRFRALKKAEAWVKELPNGLELKLLSGEHFTLENKGRDSIYQFYYYLQEMACFVVHAQYGQSEAFLLIDDKTGKMVSTKGFPKADATGSFIACLNTDWKHQGTFNGIQLLGYEGNRLQIIYEKEMDVYRPILPKWIDENTLQFTLLEKKDKFNKRSKYGQLERDKSGNWTLTL